MREKDRRFPTEEAVKQDPSGFLELARTLRAVGQVEMHGRLDVACWTTTGMVRTDNEDAFAIIHSAGSRQDDLGERILAILADGMGGYEAGEVASAMAIDYVRQQLLKDTGAALIGDAAERQADFNIQGCQDLLAKVLRETNRHVFTAAAPRASASAAWAARPRSSTSMAATSSSATSATAAPTTSTRAGCIQLTRDQTLVNRLVELGQLTPEEAEDHPRKNELQQAIGGQPTVDPRTLPRPARSAATGCWSAPTA